MKCLSLKITLFFLLCLFWFHSAVSQQKLSLKQCVDYAFKQNFDIKAQEFNIARARNSLDQSIKALIPSISGSFSQGYTSGRSIDPFSNSFVQQFVSSNSYGIGTNIILYNGQSLKNQIIQNQFLSEAEILDLQTLKRTTKNAIGLAYMQVLLNQELLNIAHEQVINLQNQVLRIKSLANEGLAAQTQIIDMEGQLAAAEFDETNALNSVSVSKLALSQIMAWPNYENLNLLPISMEDIILTNNIKVQEYVNQQSVVKSATLRLSGAKMNIQIAKALKLPSISLNMGLGTAFTNVASAELPYFKQLNYNLNEYARVGVNIPIYTQAKVKVTAAEILKDIADNQLNNVKFKIKNEIEQASLNFRNAYEKWSVAKKTLSFQQMAFVSAEERFRAGILNVIEYNAFRVNLEKAKSNLAQVKYETYFRKIILENYLTE